VVRALKRLVVLVALVMAAYAGFRWGSYVFPPLEKMLGLTPPAFIPATESAAMEGGGITAGPSAALADATLDRFERFRQGEGGDRLALGGTELSSVLRYAMPGMVPPGVADPTVELVEGRVHLKARVAVAAFPHLPQLDRILGMLPDTVALEMEGSLVAVDQATMALMVDKVEASHVPIPKRMVGDVLKGLGRQAPKTLPADAIPVPIPDGVKSVYVQRDSLVLVAKR
jgi:hypothetical protein